MRLKENKDASLNSLDIGTIVHKFAELFTKNILIFKDLLNESFDAKAREILEKAVGLSGDELAGTVSILLIFLGTLLTGVGVYDRIGRNAGAGSIVPITGFANSVASPAIEFKTEGLVYGMAAKMFIVAGPIIVFGVLSGTLVGIIYLFL